MYKRSLIGMLVLAGFVLVGCGAQPGKAVAKYERGKEAMMTEAPETATYALYASNDTTPKVSYALKKGDKLGFAQKDGKVVAVAGSNEAAVDTSMMVRTYYWKMQDVQK